MSRAAWSANVKPPIRKMVDFHRAKSVFAEEYPALRRAMDIAAKTWEAYSNALFGDPIEVRKAAQAHTDARRALDREWEMFRIKVGWSLPRDCKKWAR